MQVGDKITQPCDDGSRSSDSVGNTVCLHPDLPSFLPPPGDQNQGRGPPKPGHSSDRGDYLTLVEIPGTGLSTCWKHLPCGVE